MRDGIHVRYTGEGTREVRGVGVFQNGTVAWVPREIALEILKEDCFVAASSGRPVQAVVLRVGQSTRGAEAGKLACQGEATKREGPEGAKASGEPDPRGASTAEEDEPQPPAAAGGAGA